MVEVLWWNEIFDSTKINFILDALSIHVTVYKPVQGLWLCVHRQTRASYTCKLNDETTQTPAVHERDYLRQILLGFEKRIHMEWGRKRTGQMIGMKRKYKAKYHHTKQWGNVKFYTRSKESISHGLNEWINTKLLLSVSLGTACYGKDKTSWTRGYKESGEALGKESKKSRRGKR